MAAILVVLYHFLAHNDTVHGIENFIPTDDAIYQFSKFGKNAVYTFFVISGFVIPILLFKTEFKLSQFPSYFIKRWLRIEIPYFASMLVYLSIGFIFAFYNKIPLDIDLSRLGHHFAHSIAFSDYEWYNIIYWTLAIEFQFYIVIALIYPLISHKKLWICLTTIFIFGISSLWITDHRFIFYFSGVFSIGTVLFLVKTNRLQPTIGLGIALIFTIVNYFHLSFPIAFFGIAAYLLIQYSNYTSKFFDWLGDKSYSIYLTHGAIGGSIMYFFARNIENYYAKLGLVLVAILASFVGGYVFWLIFEKTSHRWSRNFGKKKNNGNQI